MHVVIQKFDEKNRIAKQLDNKMLNINSLKVRTKQKKIE